MTRLAVEGFDGSELGPEGNGSDCLVVKVVYSLGNTLLDFPTILERK